MQPEEFVERWHEQVIQEGSTIEKQPLVRLPAPDDRLAPSTAQFLMEADLPARTSPFVSFNHFEDGLKKIYEVYGPREDWWHGHEDRLRPFLMIGSDGGGSPICIDTSKQDQIVWVDHENHSQSFQLINSSVAQSAQLFDQFLRRMSDIDTMAMDEGNFWPDSVMDL